MGLMHQNERGQAALETAIVLIAFIIASSVFAFTLLSAGSSSTEKGKQSIQAGLQNVQSTMFIKGSVLAKGTNPNIDSVSFTVSLIAGGSSVNLNASNKEMIIGYKDQAQYVSNAPWTVTWIVTKSIPADDLLEMGEVAEITVNLTGLNPRLMANSAFNLEIKPPRGAVLNIYRTTPAGIQPVMDLD